MAIECSIRNKDRINWENKNTEFLDTTSMTKPNPFLDQIKFFFSILSPRKHEDKRTNRKKSGQNRESHGETMGRFYEIRRFSIRDRRTALCSRRRRSGCSPQLRLVLGTDRRTDGPTDRRTDASKRSYEVTKFSKFSTFQLIVEVCGYIADMY